jgi:hypothetical protein
MRHLTLAVAALAVVAGCSKTTPPARAFQITSRSELIGGKRGLGDVEPATANATDLIGGKRAAGDLGDFKLSNGVVHAIIQNVGTSRGFGSFGGSLIDVDLVRNGAGSATTGVVGNDYFTEMFPAFFLTAIGPSKVEVLKDGSDGGPAIVRVSGKSGNFISLVKTLTDVVDPKQELAYTCDYILEPGKQYLKILVTVTNPSDTVAANWGLNVPFGFVTLLGEGQNLFVPGQAGFDMRYYLEEVYKRPASLDALPGEVTPMWTTEGDGVSYALVPGRAAGGTYLDNKPTYYPTANKDSMLIPIASSSFLGTFWAKAPMNLPPKGSYSYSGFLAVGSGDVGSVQKVIYDMRETIARPKGDFVVREKVPYGTISGVVRETPTGVPLADVSVVLQNEAGEYISQALTLKNGVFTAPVPPGKYRAYAVDKTRSVVKSELVEVTEGAGTRVDLKLAQPGLLRVTVRDDKGRALPSKVSVEGVYENDVPGRRPRKLLYDLAIGERYRQSDMIPDDPANPATRRYLEQVAYAPHGATDVPLRPGTYTVYASRGIEYDLVKQQVEVKAGETAAIGMTLTQVMPTPGWVSGDFHVHSVKSVDSNMSLDERVKSYAVEGVDFLASTDHNYVSDFAPNIQKLDLGDWLHSVVGLELTSLEMGHFNAFPLVLQPGPVQHGSFRWFFRPPGELFAQLRALGTDPQKTIVQVNHPRDTVLGYFNAFNVGTYYGKPIPPTSAITLDTSVQPNGALSPYDPSNFSLDFDAMEVFNGKRFDILFSYKIPQVDPEGDAPTYPACPAGGITTFDCIPARGEVVEHAVKLTTPGQPDQYLLQPAHPGALEDWFTLLAQGRHIIPTGNSDSHGEKAEAGLPRTYIHAGDSSDQSMRALSEQDVFDAMRAGKVSATNGPFIDLSVNGVGLGGTVVAGDGVVKVHVTVKAAPWVDIKRVTLYRGGRDQVKRPFILKVYDVPATKDIVRLDVEDTFPGIPDGSFIVADAAGDEPMWPVFTPHEVPSLQISDAVGVIGGAFGFGNKYGKYLPQLEEHVTPYGFTNAIFVDRALHQPLTAGPKRVLPVSNDQPYTPRDLPDLRKLFHALHSDPQ